MTIYAIISDSSCIQVRAPDNMDGSNDGHYVPGEHIGHLGREWAAKLAPIIDYLLESHTFHYVTFECCLCDGDTSHARKGYTLNVVVFSTNKEEFNLNLVSLLRESNLQC